MKAVTSGKTLITPVLTFLPETPAETEAIKTIAADKGVEIKENQVLSINVTNLFASNIVFDVGAAESEAAEAATDATEEENEENTGGESQATE